MLAISSIQYIKETGQKVLLKLKKVLENTKIYDFLLTLLTHINHSTVPHKIYSMEALPCKARTNTYNCFCAKKKKKTILLYYYNATLINADSVKSLIENIYTLELAKNSFFSLWLSKVSLLTLFTKYAVTLCFQTLGALGNILIAV